MALLYEAGYKEKKRRAAQMGAVIDAEIISFMKQQQSDGMKIKVVRCQLLVSHKVRLRLRTKIQHNRHHIKHVL